ncbi:MFS general substrate transporter [Clavulina sp. PMI_390]|nr:MFS general substrate transporter [Clavulina sp. PMI_390]
MATRDNSPSPQADHERRPLLGSRSTSRAHSVSRTSISSKSDLSSSIFWRLAPIIVLGSLETSITTTTGLDILRGAACKIWYLVNDPASIPEDGQIPDHMCHLGQRNSPEAYYAMYFTVITFLTGLCHVITSSAIAKFANTWGRRPVFLMLNVLDVIGTWMFAFSVVSNSSIALYTLACSVMLSLLAGPLMAILVTTLMITDTTDSTNRTYVLSRVQGALWLGLAPGFVIGGYLSVATSRATPLFIAAGISVFRLIYNFLLIRETFSAPEIIASQEEDAEETQLRSQEGRLLRILGWVTAPFAPLQRLIPRVDPTSNRRNPRLLLLAIGVGVYSLGSSHLSQLLLVYSANQLYFTSKDTGIFLTLFDCGKVFVLFLVVPPVLSLGRSLYSPQESRLDTLAPEETDPSAAVHASPTPNRDKVASHFDVHLVIFSWILQAAVIVILPFAPTKAAYTAIACTWTIGAGSVPAMDSAVVASISRLDTGSVLAAMQMVKAIAEVASPLILGNLNAWSAGVFPTLTFFITAVCTHTCD